MSTEPNRPNRPMDGPSCHGCGLPNYEGLCPVCRGDYPAYEEELAGAFGPWIDPSDDEPPPYSLTELVRRGF
jgi:hypothetical protein